MITDAILVIVGLFALLAASISDIKKREVPDWISYSLIFTGFALRFMHSFVYQEWNYFYYGLLGFAITFIIGNLMFRARQWGGGDTKLVMGVGIVFATRPSFLQAHDIPFLVMMLVNILFIGAIYGIIYSIVLAIKNWKKFKPVAAKMNKDKRVIVIKIKAFIFAVSTIMITTMTQIDTELKLISSLIAFLLVIYPYLTVLIKAVEKSALYKMLPAKDLTPGDWVEQDVYKNGKIIYKQNPLGIEQGDINKLIKAKVAKVLVKEGIPFIPPFFIAALITVLVGKLLFVV